MSARLSFPDQHLPIKLELQLDVLAPSFFDAIAERPLTSRRSRRSPVRREGRSQTLHEQLALAIELLKLRLSRPPPDLRGDGCYDAFVLLRPDAVAQMLELRDHVAPETLSSGAADRVVAGDAAQECDVLLPWLTVDADALDQNGFEARSLSPPRDERLRSVSLPSNEHAVVYQRAARVAHLMHYVRSGTATKHKGRPRGRSQQRNRKGSQIVAAEARCIYCPRPATDFEHMPPRVMFRGKHRPGDMEFGCCKACNEGTGGTDVVAAVISRLHPDHGEESWQNEEIRKLIRRLDKYAPGVREEMFRPEKRERGWIRRANVGLMQPAVLVRADGPRLKAYLKIFAAKFAMALYRAHVGVALGLDGAVWCQFQLNAGLTQENLDARVAILPGCETLRQGRKNVGDQFLYRFNTDERTVVAAVAQFHRGLWLTVFASTDPRIIGLFAKPEFLAPPATAMVRPGELLSLVPAPPVT